ncbi:MAG: STAS domain-containing protein [Bacteroidales bacterium]|nr:STAS domain-containing protein [Bacteroidales bacterium]MBN2758124.1 STAS domain-containing protein [Bacteroidales bacterium]
MEILESTEGNIQIVKLEGRLDAPNTEKADDFFSKKIVATQENIVVDCKNLDYINSSGLRILIMGLKNMNKKNLKLILCNLQKNIKDVFHFSGFTNLFNVEYDFEAAINEAKN